MKRVLVAFALAGGLAGFAQAQEAATLVCDEYEAMDNAGKMEILADLDTMTGEGTQKMTAEELSTILSTQCTENPDALVKDVVTEIKKM